MEVLQGSVSSTNHLYTNGLGKFVATGAGTGNYTAAVVEGLLVTSGGNGFIDT
jgi:hypothetical protein